MRENDFDAVIIGSGAAGGWVAKKLTEAGLEVAVLEAGRKLDPAHDYKEHVLPYQLPLRGQRVSKAVLAEHQVQNESAAFYEQTSHLVVKDTENPYTTPPERPFTWIRARQVGGRTLVWGRVSLRFSDLDLKAASADGAGVDWPLDYRELAPYYDEVEDFIGVSGMNEGLPHLPDGHFLPPMNLSCGEWLMRKAVQSKFGRTLTIARAAILTRDLNGRPKCHYCGPCERGCITHSYFSSPGSTLPAAAATGKMTLLPNTVVRSIVTDASGRATAVECIDAVSQQTHQVRGRVVVLCASSLESTRVLLNSTSTQFPQGLGNASGVLGRYLMDTPVVFAGMRTVPALKSVRDSDGRRPTFFYVPRFQNLDRTKAPHLRGYGYQGQCFATRNYGHACVAGGVGAELKLRVRRGEGAAWYVWMAGFGECLPRYENHCRIDETRKDAWGIPALHIDATWGPNERAMVSPMFNDAQEMMASIGAEPGDPIAPELATPGAGIHEVGTARMGDNPETSFVNRWGQSHVVKNLYVLDGAIFPSLPCQNPTLTIMALAARGADHIAAELRARNLCSGASRVAGELRSAPSMARILFISPAGSIGHYAPYAGIAQHLKALKHHVGWIATTRARAELVASLGVEVIRTEVDQPLVIQEGGWLDDDAAVLNVLRRQFFEAIPGLLEPVRAAIRAFQPDVMVCDNQSFVGHIAASLERRPFVGVGTNLLTLGDGVIDFPFKRLIRQLDAERASTFERYGLHPDFGLFEVRSPYVNVVFATPALVGADLPLPPRVHLVGPSITLQARGDAPTDFPWSRLQPGKPLVYLALGTLFGRHRPEVAPIVARAVAHLGAQLVAAASNADALTALQLPGDPVFVSYTPQLELLQRTSVFITHAGYNSIVEALYHAVPMLAVPIFGDQPLNAQLLSQAGVALQSAPEELSVRSCQQAVETLLHTQSFRDSARRLATDVRAHDGALNAAKVIAGLCQSTA